MHKIIYSHQAQQDLEEMLDYISNESLANALAYLERYEKKIELLAFNPQMGTPCHLKNINQNCRVLPFESHLVIYEERKDKQTIFIIRVFHASSDYQTKI
jgi:plasmid stabilization system protein ParE